MEKIPALFGAGGGAMSWMSLQPGALGSLGFSWGDD